MDAVLPGERRPVTLTNLPEGLVGTLGIRLQDVEKTVVIPRTTGGFEEIAKGSYLVWLTFPDVKGFYYAVADAEGVEAIEEYQVTSDLAVLTPGPLNFVPTVDDVARLVRARLKDSNGKYLSTFTGETWPTTVMVQEEIPAGVRKVASHIGVSICEGDDAEVQQSLYDDARDLAALFVARRIERGYFPEQVGSERSPYKEMQEEWVEAKDTLVEAVSEHCGGGDGESVGDGPGPLPVSSFPEASGISEVCW